MVHDRGICKTTKPTKSPVHPAKTLISLGICPVRSVSALSTWRKFESLANHQAHNNELLSDLADAQADLSLRRAHKSFCWFCHDQAHFWYITDQWCSYGYQHSNWEPVVSDKLGTRCCIQDTGISETKAHGVSMASKYFKNTKVSYSDQPVYQVRSRAATYQSR